MREWQPGILINNRLGFVTDPKQLLAHGGGNEEGDFGTPERLVTPENRLWESNQVSTWRWWGYHRGEHWRSSAEYLDSLCTCVSAGGNLLLNVGPKADGTLPEEFCARVQEVGAWLKANGEAVYGNDGGNLTEATSYGYQTMRGNTLYVILRFYDGAATFRLADLTSEVKGVRLLSTGEALAFQKSGDDLLISLPESIRQEALSRCLRSNALRVPQRIAGEASASGKATLRALRSGQRPNGTERAIGQDEHAGGDPNGAASACRTGDGGACKTGKRLHAGP